MLADSEDPGEGLLGGGFVGGHVFEGFVAEDEVRGHAFFAGEFGAFSAEEFEEVFVYAGEVLGFSGFLFGGDGFLFLSNQGFG